MLGAYNADYDIKSLGLKFARLNLKVDHAQNTIQVNARSISTGNLLSKLDNSYAISHDSNYLPQVYDRQIKQKDWNLRVNTEYDHGKGKATMTNSAEAKERDYAVSASSRDIFSFLAYCAAGLASPGTYPIDANGVSWQVQLSEEKQEKVKTILGTYFATKYILSFRQLGKGKTPYVDMVTFNLVNSGTKVELWISQEGIPVKAKVKKGSQAMSWDLVALKR